MDKYNINSVDLFIQNNIFFSVQEVIINLFKLDKYKRDFLLDDDNGKIKNFILDKIKNSKFEKYEFMLENTSIYDFFYKYGKDFIISLDLEKQYELISSDLSVDSLVLIIPNLKREVINYFFENDNRAICLFNKFNILELINRGIKFQDSILHKKEFFDMLKDTSFIQFRKNINAVEKYNNPLIIEKFLLSYYEELINNYNKDTGLFKQYEDILNDLEKVFDDNCVSYILDSDIINTFKNNVSVDNEGNIFVNDYDELIDILKSQTSKKISEIVVDAIFCDNIYNVWLNIREMIRYNKKLSSEERILDDDKVQFYQMILSFDSVSSDEKIKFYNELKENKFSLKFYEDLRKVKDKAYDKIREDLFNPLINDEFISELYSTKTDCDVFDLRGKKYTMLVRVIGGNFYSKGNHEKDCYSIISDENNFVIRQDDKNAIVYGYSSFDNDKVLHMFESDSRSLKRIDNKLVNRIMTSRELVTSNGWYSEIQLINKKSDEGKYVYDIKNPDYIVAYDCIKDKEINESKRLGIPIVLIDKVRLKDYEKHKKSFDLEIDSYDRYESIKKSRR